MTPVNLPSVLNGCDTCGTSNERPINAEEGHPYWDTSLNQLIVKTKTGWEVVGTGNLADPPKPNDPQPIIVANDDAGGNDVRDNDL